MEFILDKIIIEGGHTRLQGEVVIEGVKTNIDFQYELLNQPDFQSGKITTDFIPQHYKNIWE